MKEHLLQLFSYNEAANTTLLTAILELPDKAEAVAMFSHVIYAQDRWYKRLDATREMEPFSWAGDPVPEDRLLNEWKRSVSQWQDVLNNSTEETLENDILFTRPSDGKNMAVKIKDVMLQLNFHAVHHRAQINRMISAQGMKVPPTDYILSALRVVD